MQILARRAAIVVLSLKSDRVCAVAAKELFERRQSCAYGHLIVRLSVLAACLIAVVECLSRYMSLLPLIRLASRLIGG